MKLLQTASSDGATALVDAHYQSMCRAIAECYAVDELKDLRDKARALEIYTRQAKNREAEDRAREIRLRAERRAGELMLKAIRAKPPGDNQYKKQDRCHGATEAPTLAKQGISKRQSADWQAIATMPEKTFENALRDPAQHPTTASMVKLAKPAPCLPTRTVNGATKIEHDTLMLHAFVVDFERKGYVSRNAAEVFGGMTETMQAQWLRIVPTMCAWFALLPFMQGRNHEEGNR
jgi:hypothetical protein